MWCFVKTAAIFLCKAVSLYSRSRPRMSCASRIFWSSKNLSRKAILLFIREQYAVAVRLLSLFGQSGIIKNMRCLLNNERCLLVWLPPGCLSNRPISRIWLMTAYDPTIWMLFSTLGVPCLNKPRFVCRVAVAS